MGFADYATSAKLRDLVERISRAIVQEERPRYRYGTVSSMDYVTQRAWVEFGPNEAAVPVRCGTIYPAPGATVRVNGVIGDRYIEAVILGDYELRSAGAPVGSMVAGGFIDAPSGWLPCDGRALSRTEYSRLFSAIETRFGAGNGSTTFNLPNMLSRYPMGAGQHISPGMNFGSNTRTLLTSNLPRHSHDAGDLSVGQGGSHSHTINYRQTNAVSGTGLNLYRPATNEDGVSGQGVSSQSSHTHSISGSTGDTGTGQSFDNRPLSLTLTWIIKY